MAAALPWIVGGLATGSTIMQVSAANKAKDASRANEAAIRAETQEEARRLANEQREVEARTRASAAASGAGMGSQSQLSYIDKMKKEHSSELAWLRKSGSMRSDIARRQGNAAYASGIAGAMSTLASGAGSVYSFMNPTPPKT